MAETQKQNKHQNNDKNWKQLFNYNMYNEPFLKYYNFLEHTAYGETPSVLLYAIDKQRKIS